MPRLQRIALRVMRRVGILDLDIVGGQTCEVGVDSSNNVAMGHLVAIPHARAFHLVKDRVVAAVDLVPSIDIGADQIAIAGTGAEESRLVGACVCPQQSLAVDVIRVGAATTRVVRGKAQRVKVLMGRDYGVEVVMIAVRRPGKLRFKNLSGNEHRVILSEVELATRRGEDVGGDIVPGVGRICFTVYCNDWWCLVLLF